MDTLILEDFRCFAGRHEVPIRPLTLLVGENSTGKTSFLAGVRAALDRAEPNFNRGTVPPRQLRPDRHQPGTAGEELRGRDDSSSIGSV